MHITITRKRMKTMRISVEPSDGSVKVSAPKRVSVKQITDFVTSKKAWIEKTQEYYKTAKELLVVKPGEILLHGEGYGIANYELRAKKESSF